jgi:hypothetical protein
MTDCPNCEYHRQRAQNWREEAYKLSGHPLPEREWVGLTDEERDYFTYIDAKDKARFRKYFDYVETKLKEKNYG